MNQARLEGHWVGRHGMDSYEPGWQESEDYTCGFCGRHVASERGWSDRYEDHSEAEIRICPKCNRPTFLEGKSQYPGIPIGEAVKHLPPDIECLYNESRASASANAPTAAVLALRKLLMNVAVHKGAPTNQSFQQYVDYLAKMGYVSPDGKIWVNHIREKGNDANHEIALMKPTDAEDLIAFAEMLLKTIYEFPNRVPKKK
jgi:hypothetical protein